MKSIAGFSLFLILILSSCSYREQFSTVYTEKNNHSPLIALNRTSFTGEISGKKKQDLLLYRFTPEQKQKIEENGALQIDLEITGRKNSADSYYKSGFLHSENFKRNGKFCAKQKLNAIVNGSPAYTVHDRFSVSMAAEKNKEPPEGFFISSSESLILKSAFFVSPKSGKILNTEKCEFHFMPWGGTLSQDFSKMDYTNESGYFSADKSRIKIYTRHTDQCGSYKDQTKIKIKYGNEKISLRKSPAVYADIYELPLCAFENSFDIIEIIENSDYVEGIILVQEDSAVPVKTDLGLIKEWPQKNWRKKTYEVFEWNLFPGVLFFDFDSYKTQNHFFTRLAYFAEKQGYKGTLVSDWFVENKHGYNAHDYKAKDLADFFTLAEQTEFSLNQEELELRKILIDNSIIIKTSYGYCPNELGGAVISFSRESPDYLRHVFMAHESWHGIFFTNSDFRNITAVCYSMFDPVSLDFIKTFWSTQPGLGYDTNDEYLMQNEFMAYIMQQSYANIKPYFTQVAGRGSVMANEKELAKYVRETNAQAFEDAGRVLNDYAFKTWGLAAGRVALIERN